MYVSLPAHNIKSFKAAYSDWTTSTLAKPRDKGSIKARNYSRLSGLECAINFGKVSLLGCGFREVIRDLIEQVAFMSPNMTSLDMQTQFTPSTQKLISDTRVVSAYKGPFKYM